MACATVLIGAKETEGKEKRIQLSQLRLGRRAVNKHSWVSDTSIDRFQAKVSDCLVQKCHQSIKEIDGGVVA